MNMLISDLKGGLFQYDVKDYYAILGMPISASPKDIRLRYLKLAYQLHPDTNQSKSREEKALASSILSKLVNPAYENLYKDKLRRECQLIFSELAYRLAPEIDRITLSSELAKKLLKETTNLDKIYKEAVEKIAQEQYQDLSKLHLKIAILSELNLVYLLRQKREELGKIMGTTPTVTVPDSTTTVARAATPSPEKQEKTPVSRLDKLIASAQKHLQENNLEAAMFDLREAVKLEPNSAMAHALLGSVYLKQGNLPYARIHINKALSLDANNPTVKQAQQELKEKDKTAAAKADAKKPDAKKDKKEDKDKKKKEPPKIFGIPLW
ncbi:MAG: DnaJ domain-containing protein [Geminocystis sp.]|nr:DnaJ domain-containing protein [Geminocystis sp.]MCX8077912.1 DnaJ domain-containing protein [Geminocystis sp.]MDW8115202.1 DnaJ domain-containing protein [Geminocystis sp.]